MNAGEISVEGIEDPISEELVSMEAAPVEFVPLVKVNEAISEELVSMEGYSRSLLKKCNWFPGFQKN